MRRLRIGFLTSLLVPAALLLGLWAVATSYLQGPDLRIGYSFLPHEKDLKPQLQEFVEEVAVTAVVSERDAVVAGARTTTGKSVAKTSAYAAAVGPIAVGRKTALAAYTDGGAVADAADAVTSRPTAESAAAAALSDANRAAAHSTLGAAAAGDADEALIRRAAGAAAAAAAIKTYEDLAEVVPNRQCLRDANASATALYARGTPNLTLIVLVRQAEDSALVQTVLSAVAFTPPDILREIILAYSTEVTKDFLAAVYKLLERYANVFTIRTVGGTSDFRAVVAAVSLAKSQYLAVAHDNILFAGGWLEPLLETVQREGMSVAVPHLDALLPNLVYNHPYQQQVYEEEESITWNLNWDLKYKMQPRPYLYGGKWMDSPVTIGDALVTTKRFFSSITEVGEVESFMEFSFLAWMCGRGIRLGGCSRVLKSNKYFVFPPSQLLETRDAMARRYLTKRLTYYLSSSANSALNSSMDYSATFRDALEKKSCKNFEWYAREIAELPYLDLPQPEVDRMVRMGQLMNRKKNRCFGFKDDGIAWELENCGVRSSLLYTTFGGILRRGSQCLSADADGVVALRQCNDTAVATVYRFMASLLITDGVNCMVSDTGRNKGSPAITVAACPAADEPFLLDMLWLLI